MIVLLPESFVAMVVLAKAALIKLNLLRELLRLGSKLNPVIHLHLLPRLYSLQSMFHQIVWYKIHIFCCLLLLFNLLEIGIQK